MNKIFIAFTTIVTLALSACSDTRAQTSGENKQGKPVSDGSNAPAEIHPDMDAWIQEKVVGQQGQRAYNGFAWSLYQDENIVVAVFERAPLKTQLGGIKEILQYRLHKFTPKQAENVVRLAKQYSPYPEVHELIEDLPIEVRARIRARQCAIRARALQTQMYELDVSISSIRSLAIDARNVGCNEVAEEAERILQFRSGFGK